MFDRRGTPDFGSHLLRFSKSGCLFQTEEYKLIKIFIVLTEKDGIKEKEREIGGRIERKTVKKVEKSTDIIKEIQSEANV